MTDVQPSALRATPDDGRRRSDTPVWDEATRPHADRAAGPAHPTARGLAAAQSLLDVHADLRTELDRVRRLVRDVLDDRLAVAAARDVLNRMALRQRRWTVSAHCAAYCTLLTQHHYGEDVEIFPQLRAADPALQGVLRRLEEEHVTIHALLDRVDAALVGMVGGDGAAERIGAVVDQLTDALLSHLSYEEHELLGPMARVFG